MNKKQQNYSILLVSEKEVMEIAVIKSKGLAYMLLKELKNIYKDKKLIIQESKKRLNVSDTISYYLNSEKV